MLGISFRDDGNGGAGGAVVPSPPEGPFLGLPMLGISFRDDGNRGAGGDVVPGPPEGPPYEGPYEVPCGGTYGSGTKITALPGSMLSRSARAPGIYGLAGGIVAGMFTGPVPPRLLPERGSVYQGGPTGIGTPGTIRPPTA